MVSTRRDLHGFARRYQARRRSVRWPSEPGTATMRAPVDLLAAGRRTLQARTPARPVDLAAESLPRRHSTTRDGRSRWSPVADLPAQLPSASHAQPFGLWHSNRREMQLLPHALPLLHTRQQLFGSSDGFSRSRRGGGSAGFSRGFSSGFSRSRRCGASRAGRCGACALAGPVTSINPASNQIPTRIGARYHAARLARAVRRAAQTLLRLRSAVLLPHYHECIDHWRSPEQRGVPDLEAQYSGERSCV